MTSGELALPSSSYQINDAPDRSLDRIKKAEFIRLLGSGGAAGRGAHSNRQVALR
jgi:hypothetical protein